MADQAAAVKVGEVGVQTISIRGPKKGVENEAGVFVEMIDHKIDCNNTKSEADISQSATTLPSTAADSSLFTLSPIEVMAQIYTANAKTLLLSMPDEIKLKIWEFAVTANEPIYPRQVALQSNKFSWSKIQIGSGELINAAAVAPLTVVSLTKVCKKIYEEVALSYLFYKTNQIYFNQSYHYRNVEKDMVFLFAITENRLKSIRSISCHWDSIVHRPYRKSDPKLLLPIFACENLEDLELRIPYRMARESSNSSIETTETFLQCTQLVRGLKNLTFTVDTVPVPSRSIGWLLSPLDANDEMQRNETIELVKGLSASLHKHMGKPRIDIKPAVASFKILQQKADLDIFGQGRLGGDRKPGIVSSRTRGQLRAANNIDHQGRLSKASPKYDLDGNLAWTIVGITDSREAQSDDGLTGVQFLVHYNSRSRHYPNGTSKNCSWEDAYVLVSDHCRSIILDFYIDRIESVGKESLMKFWESLPVNVEFPDMNQRYWLRQLGRLMAEENRVKKMNRVAELESARANAKCESGESQKTGSKKRKSSSNAKPVGKRAKTEH